MTNESKIKSFFSKYKFNIKIEKEDAFAPPYINPIYRLLIYLYIILVSGNVFMGWTGFQELLYKAGSFEDLCDESTIEYITIRSNTIIDCPARKTAINNLYSLTFSTNILFSIFSGLILDFFGQKLTFIIGQFTNFICWILIGLFPKNGILLKVIMVVIGLTAESLYIPLTTVSLYFPENKSTILSIMGSFRTLSFFVTSVISYIYLNPRIKKESFTTVAIVFAFVVYFGCFIIGCFIVQRNFFEKSKNNEIINTEKVFKKTYKVSDLCKKTWTSLSEGVKHPQFLQTFLFTIAASTHMLSVEFLNMSQREILSTSDGKSAVNLFRYTHVFTFVPGIFIGVIIDKIGCPETVIILQIFILLSYLMVALDDYILKLLGCWLYLFGGTLYLTVIYCYVYEFYPPERLGLVLGFILIVCGSFILLNIPLYKYGINLSKTRKFSNVSWILMGIISMGILATTGVIYLKSRRKSNNFRKVDENK